ncbi:hypothetical protein H1W37_00725 [Stappia taiwanensis]|uniref:Uncharacterized protein n=1 Tax=Stappia taiwanensis TaxID=992267 RepID=A0A838XJV6_9HYPH|nr:DUF6494 family protein [Stappia taiwanensis]MBA4610157.1 hypothetical protein [Stappia taiwanensis]GGE77308.1 hypothetical protein GCM10007285_01440 [Stappia taiwanensis]
MTNDTFNMSMRKFLKQVGVTSQQALEAHVRDAGLTSGSLSAKVVLTLDGQEFEHVVTGKIDLD